MKYLVQTNVPICPVCKGTLKRLEQHYKCWDCNSAFKILGEGMNTDELELELLKYEEDEK